MNNVSHLHFLHENIFQYEQIKRLKTKIDQVEPQLSLFQKKSTQNFKIKYVSHFLEFSKNTWGFHLLQPKDGLCQVSIKSQKSTKTFVLN